MSTNTLKTVVTMINARINLYENADANDPFYQGAVAALKSLEGELQSFIETDLSGMGTIEE